jgi:hypothetical protein
VYDIKTDRSLVFVAGVDFHRLAILASGMLDRGIEAFREGPLTYEDFLDPKGGDDDGDSPAQA